MKPLLSLGDHYECTVLGRLNRFVVLVEHGGREWRAYINNTGRLRELLVRGRRAYCLDSRGERTRFRLIAVEEESGAALIDTRLQMESFEAAVEGGLLPWARGCRVAGRNPRLGSSVLDYLLDCPGGRVYVEVKSAVLRLPGGGAGYPDCPTLRGRRHLRELAEHARRGGRGLVVFIAGLPGARYFSPYGEGDPEIPRLLREAIEAGVEARAVALHYRPRERTVVLEDPDIPVVVP